MVWITVGIILYGLLMGLVYTEVTKVNSPPPAHMDGNKRVGSLLFREYDAMMVSRNGGKSIRNDDEFSHRHSQFDFLNLLTKLQEKEIDGIALDQYFLVYIFWINDQMVKGDLDQLFRKRLKPNLISLPCELGSQRGFLLCPLLLHPFSHTSLKLFPDEREG